MTALTKKLEGDKLAQQCEDEIRALHTIFVTWFRGKAPIETLKNDLLQRMSSQFSHVAPNGHMVIGRDVLIRYLTEKYSCYKDRTFSIDVYNVQLLWSSPTHCLAGYEEWQSWDDEDEENGVQQFGRLSTCLLERVSDGSGGLKFIHVHETWMEAEEPTVTNNRKVAMVDEDTVMTGPVPKEEAKRSAPAAKRSVLTEESEASSSSVDLLPPKPSRQILVLIHSKSLSETQTKNQEICQKLTKDSGLPFVVVDVANPGSTDVNDLLAKSGAAMYPQIFVKTAASTDLWGTWDDFERCNEEGNLQKDLRLSKAPKPKSDQKKLSNEMTHEERQFLEASQGILFFEDEEESSLPPKKEENGEDDQPFFLEAEGATIQESAEFEDHASQAMISLNSASGASHKRHVSPKLDRYAKPLMFENTLVGVSIAGFVVGTSQGPIADSGWYADIGARLEKLAQSGSTPRKINLPEMVFPAAHVALEGRGIWMSWDVVDCLEMWANCHKSIPAGTRVAHEGVSVLQVKDAVAWGDKHKHISASKGARYHYDWTFSTPFIVKMEGGSWLELDESGMRMDLLTDKTVPILFFDEIILFEDDLHDNGHAQFSIKLRIMPTCAYILARLWVRIDNILVRVHETRILVDFFGIQPQIFRDVTWRECAWSDLPAHGLPNDVRAWTCENGETEAWNNLVQNIPRATLPTGMLAHSVLEYGNQASSAIKPSVASSSSNMVEV